MNKPEENPKIQALSYFIITLVISLILWPLLDLLWCALFTHSQFAYSPSEHILTPFIFSIVMTILFYVLPSRKKRK